MSRVYCPAFCTCGEGVICRLVPVRAGSVVIKGNKAPRITQIIKEMSKCRNAQNSEGAWPLFFRSLKRMAFSPLTNADSRICKRLNVEENRGYAKSGPHPPTPSPPLWERGRNKESELA